MSTEFWHAVVQQSWDQMEQPGFWLGVAQIIWVNILLSGDNAVVIALACRGLPPRQRIWGMILGSAVAVVLRIAFTGLVATLMQLPYLKLVGGVALLYIATRLLVPEDEPGDADVEAVERLWRVIRIVAVADIIMSLDNIIAVAAVAQGSLLLLILGLGISVPLIVAGSAIVMTLLDRFPILVWAGAALLGWIAGEVIATDPVVKTYVDSQLAAGLAHQAELAAAIVGAVFVIVVGGLWRRMRRPAESKV